MPYAYRRPGNYSTLRRRILARDQWTCHVCRAAGASELDHVIPMSVWISQGREKDGWAPENLAAICAPCHTAKSARERAEGRRRHQQTYGRRRAPEPHPNVKPS